MSLTQNSYTPLKIEPSMGTAIEQIHNGIATHEPNMLQIHKERWNKTFSSKLTQCQLSDYQAFISATVDVFFRVGGREGIQFSSSYKTKPQALVMGMNASKMQFGHSSALMKTMRKSAYMILHRNGVVK